MCPPNSPDLNLVDYAIWSVIQQRVYETRVHDMDELRQRLLHVWCSLEQSLIDDAVDQCPTVNTLACLCSCQRHTFEHTLWLSNCYSALVGVLSIVINPSVCLSASISLELLNSFSQNFVCGSLCRGSVLLQQCCPTLCTSGFMDDVTFGRNGRDAEGEGWHMQWLHCHEWRGDTGAESIMSMNA